MRSKLFLSFFLFAALAGCSNNTDDNDNDGDNDNNTLTINSQPQIKGTINGQAFTISGNQVSGSSNSNVPTAGRMFSSDFIDFSPLKAVSVGIISEHDYPLTKEQFFAAAPAVGAGTFLNSTNLKGFCFSYGDSQHEDGFISETGIQPQDSYINVIAIQKLEPNIQHGPYIKFHVKFKVTLFDVNNPSNTRVIEAEAVSGWENI